MALNLNPLREIEELRKRNLIRSQSALGYLQQSDAQAQAAGQQNLAQAASAAPAARRVGDVATNATPAPFGGSGNVGAKGYFDNAAKRAGASAVVTPLKAGLGAYEAATGAGLAAPAVVGDLIRRGIAGVQGQEVVNPTLLQDKAFARLDRGVGRVADVARTVGGVIPVGATVPAVAAPAAAATQAGATGATGPTVRVGTTVAAEGATGAAAPTGTVSGFEAGQKPIFVSSEIPTIGGGGQVNGQNNLVRVFTDNPNTPGAVPYEQAVGRPGQGGGTVSVVNFSDGDRNVREFLRGREADAAQRRVDNAIIGEKRSAADEAVAKIGQRNELQNQLTIAKGRGNRREVAALQADLAELRKPVARPDLRTAGDLAQTAVAQKQAQATIDEQQRTAENQQAINDLTKEFISLPADDPRRRSIGETLLTLQGTRPEQRKFQVVTQEEPILDESGFPVGTRKTPYIIDEATGQGVPVVPNGAQGGGTKQQAIDTLTAQFKSGSMSEDDYRAGLKALGIKG